jgi:hypothetical protein
LREPKGVSQDPPIVLLTNRPFPDKEISYKPNPTKPNLSREKDGKPWVFREDCRAAEEWIFGSSAFLFETRFNKASAGLPVPTESKKKE